MWKSFFFADGVGKKNPVSLSEAIVRIVFMMIEAHLKLWRKRKRGFKKPQNRLHRSIANANDFTSKRNLVCLEHKTNAKIQSSNICGGQFRLAFLYTN